MPATAARCGRAPVSRRAAIRTSAGVRTLTTPAWARTAFNNHRGGAAEGFPCDVNRVGASLAGDGQRAPGMSYITPAVPDMDYPPGRYGVTVRVDKDDGHSLPDPAVFAVAASR